MKLKKKKQTQKGKRSSVGYFLKNTIVAIRISLHSISTLDFLD